MELWDTIVLSVKVAALSTLLVTISAFFLASLLQTRRWRMLKLLELFIYLPMAIPPVALGYGLLLTLGPASAIGEFFHQFMGLDLTFSFLGGVIAASSVSLGLGLRSMRHALELVDQNQIDVARLLGATRWQIWWTIIFPQTQSMIIGGIILVFIRGLSEFGATMVLMGSSLNGNRTLALSIWVAMETPGRERECLLLVLVAVAIALLALVLVDYLSRRPTKLEMK